MSFVESVVALPVLVRVLVQVLEPEQEPVLVLVQRAVPLGPEWVLLAGRRPSVEIPVLQLLG